MFYTKICFIQKYVLYRNMLFFGDFFNTQSDQVSKRTKLHHIFKIFSGKLAYACNYN